MNFLAIEFLNNKLSDYLLAVGILIGSIILIKTLRNIAFRSFKKWATRSQNIYDDALIKILEHNLIPLATEHVFRIAVD